MTRVIITENFQHPRIKKILRFITARVLFIIMTKWQCASLVKKSSPPRSDSSVLRINIYNPESFVHGEELVELGGESPRETTIDDTGVGS